MLGPPGAGVWYWPGTKGRLLLPVLEISNSPFATAALVRLGSPLALDCIGWDPTFLTGVVVSEPTSSVGSYHEHIKV